MVVSVVDVIVVQIVRAVIAAKVITNNATNSSSNISKDNSSSRRRIACNCSSNWVVFSCFHSWDLSESIVSFTFLTVLALNVLLLLRGGHVLHPFHDRRSTNIRPNPDYLQSLMYIGTIIVCLRQFAWFTALRRTPVCSQFSDQLWMINEGCCSAPQTYCLNKHISVCNYSHMNVCIVLRHTMSTLFITTWGWDTGGLHGLSSCQFDYDYNGYYQDWARVNMAVKSCVLVFSFITLRQMWYLNSLTHANKTYH